MTIFNGTTRPELSVILNVGGTLTSIPNTDILEWVTFRGRRQRFDPLQQGTAVITLNNVSGNYSDLTVGNQITIWMNMSDGVSNPYESVFSGEIHQVERFGGINPIARVTVWDLLWKLDAAILPASFLNAYDLETSGVRAQRILDDTIDVTAYDDNGYPGAVNLLSSFGNITALTALEQCHAAEAGYFYIPNSGAGVVCSSIEDRWDRYTNGTHVAFTDTGTANTAPILNITMTPGTADLINAVTVQRPSRQTSGGTVIRAEYSDSVLVNGVLKEMKWTAPVYTDEAAQALAVYLARVRAYPIVHPTYMEVSGLDFLRWTTFTDNTQYQPLLNIDIGDVISVTYADLTRLCVVEGISHVANGSRWNVRFWLSPADGFTCNIAAGISTAPDYGASTDFVYDVPELWLLGAATETVRTANSLDIKWRDFSDRGAATGGTGTPLELYANAKQHIVYDANSTGAYQFDCKGGSATAMPSTLVVGQCVTFDVLIKCNDTSHYANSAIKVDGSTTGVTTIWLGGAPTAGTVGGWDHYTITVYLVNDTPTYRVVAEWKASA